MHIVYIVWGRSEQGRTLKGCMKFSSSNFLSVQTLKSVLAYEDEMSCKGVFYSSQQDCCV